MAQRTWMRIETPWTHQGHAMRAELGGRVWTGWEAEDGTYRLKEGSVAPGERDNALPFASWTLARKHAERAANPVQVAPLIAGAAVGGALTALRGHMQANPGPIRFRNPFAAAAYCAQAVGSAVPPTWYAGVGPTLGPGGVVTIRVRRGYRRAAEAAVRRAGLACPVSVIESGG